MKRSSKILSVLLSVVLAFGFMLNSFAAIDITTAQPIRFDENGNLRVMHVTDNHLGTDNVEDTVWLIGEACDREQPDIAVITGDNVENIGDLQKEMSALEQILSKKLGTNLKKAYKAYLVLEENEDDEKSEETLEQCDDVFYENEEEINYALEEYASKIEL